VCSSDQVCVTFSIDERRIDGQPGDMCRNNADCAESSGESLCRGGRCLPLTDSELGCVSSNWGTSSPPDGSEVMPIGMLVPATELGAIGRPLISAAVGTAINELNRARNEHDLRDLPPLVGIACDESSEEALDYLLESLEVPVVIGPASSSRVERAIDRSAGRALLMLPNADGPNLEPEVGDSLAYVVGCRPNRSGVRSYFLDAVRTVIARIQASGEPSVTPVLAVSEDVSTESFASGINQADLTSAGVRRLEYTSEAGGRGLVSALKNADPPPNLVIAASGEDAWEDNIPAVDNATFGNQGFYPYYLLANKRLDLLETLIDMTTAEGFPRQYERLLGLDYHRSERSRQAYEEFRVAFEVESGGGDGSDADPGLEYAYDCAYVAAYAAVAAEQRRLVMGRHTGAALATSIDSLSGGETAIPVRALSIPDVIAQLLANDGEPESLDLIGTSGDLDFEAAGAEESKRHYYRPTPPDGELYCISRSGVKTFCDTGVVFPVEGGEPSPDNGRCDCLGAP
jgi:hypothetical protein